MTFLKRHWSKQWLTITHLIDCIYKHINNQQIQNQLKIKVAPLIGVRDYWYMYEYTVRFNGTVSTETDHIVTVQFTRTQYIAYSLQSNPARYYRTIEVSHRGSFLSDVPAYLCSQTILFFICRAHSCVTHKIADYHNKWQINERTSVYSKDPWNLLKQIALKGFFKKKVWISSN